MSPPDHTLRLEWHVHCAMCSSSLHALTVGPSRGLDATQACSRITRSFSSDGEEALLAGPNPRGASGTLSGLKDLTLLKPAVVASAVKDMISHRLPTQGPLPDVFDKASGQDRRVSAGGLNQDICINGCVRLFFVNDDVEVYYPEL